MAERAETPDDTPAERLHDRIDRADDKPAEMQRRLDELGEGIDEARRQAEADDLLPGGDEHEDNLDPMDWPGGDRSVETPLNDTDFEAGG